MSLLTSIIVTGGFLLVSYILMGLPSIFVYAPASVFIKLIIGKDKYEKMHDEVWPCLLITSLIWPLFFPLWNFLAYKVITINVKKVWVLILGFYLTGVIISTIVFLIISRRYKEN